MRMKSGLTVLAGAMALGLSSGAMAAVTTAGSQGTLFVEINDSATSTQFVFDTGLAANADVASGTSFNLSGDANYQAFLTANSGALSSLSYSVLGAGIPATGIAISEFTATSLPTTTAGTKANDAAIQISNLLSAINNPKGGSSYQPAGGTGVYWIVSYQGAFNADLGGATDTAAIGTPIQMYSLVALNTGSRGGATVSTLSNSWTLNSSGLLTYGAAAVPLPAPLVLLLSGLGLMGVVSRRRQSVA